MKRMLLLLISMLFLVNVPVVLGGEATTFLPELKPNIPPTGKALFSTPEYEQKTLNRVNYYRSLAGLDDFSLSETLSLASQAHATYLKINELLGHYEDKDEYPEGFTGVDPSDRAEVQGYQGTVGEVISYGHEAEEGVDSLITAIYHRFGLLNPGYTEAGVGDDSYPAPFYYVQVINPARPQGTTEPTGIISVYPADGQTDVPLKFNSDDESPDPVPDTNTVGYPVSIQFSSDYETVTLTDFTISKNSVPLYATILDPVQDENTPENAFSVIPLAELEPETVYDVLFQWTVNAESYEKQWSFTTGKEPVLTASATGLIIGAGQTGEVRLSNVESSYTANWSNSNVINVTTSPGPKLIITGLKAGTSNITVTDSSEASVQIAVTVSDSIPALDLTLIGGWNLISSRTGFDVSNELSNGNSFKSVWKWEENNWTVYLPGETDGGVSYAAAKGFNNLSTINPGEGFWVNSVGSGSLSISGTQEFGSLTLTQGWNLIGLRKSEAITITELITGNEQQITSIWKWAGNNWAVYLPGTEDGGASYAQGKGFEPLENIDPNEGFWVNAEKGMVLD